MQKYIAKHATRRRLSKFFFFLGGGCLFIGWIDNTDFWVEIRGIDDFFIWGGGVRLVIG